MIQVFERAGDEWSPKIILNHNENIFFISGESRPEHPVRYYEPVFEWFKEYAVFLKESDLLKTKTVRKIKVELDYFNSTSSKILFDMFLLLKQLKEAHDGFVFEADWYFDEEDTDMLDAGKEMQKLSGLTFNFISKK